MNANPATEDGRTSFSSSIESENEIVKKSVNSPNKDKKPNKLILKILHDFSIPY